MEELEEQKFKAKSLEYLRKMIQNGQLSNGQVQLRAGEFKDAMKYIDAAQDSVNSFMTAFKEKVDELREEHEKQIESLETKVAMLEAALKVNNDERRRTTANLIHAFVLHDVGAENPTAIEVAITLLVAMEKIVRDNPDFHAKFINLLQHYIPSAQEEAKRYL